MSVHQTDAGLVLLDAWVRACACLRVPPHPTLADAQALIRSVCLLGVCGVGGCRWQGVQPELAAAQARSRPTQRPPPIFLGPKLL